MKLQNKTLSDLGLTSQSGANPAITGITNDSRKVCDGFLFAALPPSTNMLQEKSQVQVLPVQLWALLIRHLSKIYYGQRFKWLV